MKLYKSIEPQVVVDDMVYEYHNDFRLYLKAYEILQDEDIFDEDKIKAICGFLFKDKINDVLLGKNLIEAFFKKYAGDNRGSGEACFSIEQDAEVIYSAFWQTYQINLFKKKLTIEEFLALLRGLPKNTRFSEIVEIRTMPIPKPTKYNEEQRCAIIKAKQSVRLRTSKHDVSEDWRGFGEMIKTLAKRG